MFAKLIRWVRRMLGFGLGLGMSRGAGGAASSVPVNTVAPELTGVPRDGEYATIYAGTWDRIITDYRYNVKIDGAAMTGFPQTTAEDAISFAWPTAAVDGVYTATVEASADSGATWSSAVAVELAPLFPSIVITAATRTITGTRTSLSTEMPMLFDLGGKRYSSDQWEYVVYDTDDATELFRSTIPISDDELGSPFTPDWSGDVDPVPVPPIPAWATLSGTPALLYLGIRLVSGDYMPGADGVPMQGIVSNRVSLSPTDAPGYRYWKINFPTDSVVLLREIELATSISGANAASGKTYTVYSDAGPGNANFAASRFFDANHSTDGGLADGTPPYYIIIDFGAPADLHELRMYSDAGFASSAPHAFTLAPSADNVTYGSAVVTAASLTWTGDETKTWSW